MKAIFVVTIWESSDNGWCISAQIRFTSRGPWLFAGPTLDGYANHADALEAAYDLIGPMFEELVGKIEANPTDLASAIEFSPPLPE